MHVKLKVLQGRLTGQSGRNRAGEILIRRPRFLIGGAEDCHMRCPSSSISAHHCELLVDERGVRIHDLHSETGTFVNNCPVNDEVPLNSGDTLRIGRLEFSVQLEFSSETGSDAVSEYVSTLLVEADEEDRVRRLGDPEARRFQPESAQPERPDASGEQEPKRLERPPRRPPKKLPPPPEFVAENTEQAAEETLKKIFGPKK